MLKDTTAFFWEGKQIKTPNGEVYESTRREALFISGTSKAADTERGTWRRDRAGTPTLSLPNIWRRLGEHGVTELWDAGDWETAEFEEKVYSVATLLYRATAAGTKAVVWRNGLSETNRQCVWTRFGLLGL